MAKKKKAAKKKRKPKRDAGSAAAHGRVAAITVRRMKLEELTPAPYNPRRMDSAAIAGLAASIKRFGILEPIVFNEETGHIVGGHRRLDVLRAEGFAEADVLVASLPLVEEKAANVSLNNPAIQGQFDDGLPDLLDELRLDLGDDSFMEIRLEGLEVAPPGEPPEFGAGIGADVAMGRCPKCGDRFALDEARDQETAARKKEEAAE